MMKEKGFGIGMLSTPPTMSEVLIQGNINFQNTNNNIVMDAEIIYDEVPQKAFPMIDGAKVDDLFFFAPQEVTLNFGPFNNSMAYFNEQDASYIPLVSGGNDCAISEPEECVESQYVGKTNSQLSSQYSNSFCGTITPSTVVTHPMIIGGKVSDVTTSIADLEVQSDCLILHPNPTNGFFKIQGDFTNYSIQILSSNGTLHQDLSNQNSPIEIDLSSLPNGLYFVKVVNGQNGDILHSTNYKDELIND